MLNHLVAVKRFMKYDIFGIRWFQFKDLQWKIGYQRTYFSYVIIHQAFGNILREKTRRRFEKFIQENKVEFIDINFHLKPFSCTQ